MNYITTTMDDFTSDFDGEDRAWKNSADWELSGRMCDAIIAARVTKRIFNRARKELACIKRTTKYIGIPLTKCMLAQVDYERAIYRRKIAIEEYDDLWH